VILSQTSHVLVGATIALLYAGTVMGIGIPLLGISLGRQASVNVRARVGLFGFVWLGFVLGQGVLGVMWLTLSLGGVLSSWIVWNVFAVGWLLLSAMTLARRHEIARAVRLTWFDFLSFVRSRSWYLWVAIGMVIVLLLHGMIALLPPWVDDALKQYLVEAKVIAVSQTLDFQRFLHPYYALQPVQVQLHWAALFAVSSETAVTTWDYFCALSFLSGVGLLAWSLTSNKSTALVAVLMMLSTPAFYAMMGGGKIDNASAQYGVAAFVWIVLWPALGLRATIPAGLCIGWAMAGRYTNFILLPGLALIAIIVACRNRNAFPVDSAGKGSKRYWLTTAFLCGIAAAIAGVPMLIKNLLLVGCPLAPQFGCQDRFWASMFKIIASQTQTISIVDLLFYPFVLTFATRDSMLGNISPLFIGFLPILIVIYRRSFGVRSALIAGLAGIVSVSTWLLIEPLVLYTRLFLVPLGLLSVPLSASVVAVDQDRRQDYRVRWLIRGAVAAVLFFVLFDSRGVIYAGRYLASIDSRADWYHLARGYDVAGWIHAHVQPGDRVALGNYKGHRYFVDPRVLLNSESAEELQWLWEHGDWRYGGSGSISPSSWTADFWRFYTDRGFTYVVVANYRMQDALSAWPSKLEGVRLQIAAVGRENGILKIAKQ
jgi:hypothetical protein